MDLVILVFKLAAWLASNGSGGGAQTEEGGSSGGDCARGQITPC